MHKSVPVRNISTKPSAGVKDTSRKKYSGLKYPLKLFGVGAGSGGNLSNNEVIVVVSCMACCIFAILVLVFFWPWYFILLAVLPLFCYALTIIAVLVHERTLLLISVLFLMVLTCTLIILFIVDLAIDLAKPRHGAGLAIVIVLLIFECLCNGVLIYFAWKLSGGLS